MAHLLDVFVTPLSGTDPSSKGQLRGGQVRLLCSTMLEVLLEKGPHRTSRGSYFPDGWVSRFRLSVSESEFGLDGNLSGEEVEGEEIVTFEPTTDWSDYSHPSTAPFFLLPLFDSCAGLILAPTGKAKGQYRRIGSFWFEQDTKPPLWFLDPLIRVREEAFAERVEDERYPDQHWVVTIV